MSGSRRLEVIKEAKQALEEEARNGLGKRPRRQRPTGKSASAGKRKQVRKKAAKSQPLRPLSKLNRQRRHSGTSRIQSLGS